MADKTPPRRLTNRAAQSRKRERSRGSRAATSRDCEEHVARTTERVDAYAAKCDMTSPSVAFLCGALGLPDQAISRPRSRGLIAHTTAGTRKEAEMGEFAWFDLRTDDAGGAQHFYSELLGWQIAQEGEMPPMIAGSDGPWALIGGAPLSGGSQWLPYVRVDDLEAATRRAEELGATVLHARTEGPAGAFTTIADPTGAPVALWQAAAA